jgi:DNA mismatch endonuclease, patch repair protein
MDVHEPAIRCYNMSQIKGKDTKPEMLVRRPTIILILTSCY